MRSTDHLFSVATGAVHEWPVPSVTVTVMAVPVTTFWSGDMLTVISENRDTLRSLAGMVTVSALLTFEAPEPLLRAVQVRWVIWLSGTLGA